MIIQVPYKEGDTVSMKLTSGEEVMGKFEGKEGTVLKIKNPLMLTMAQEGMGLAPFMFTVGPNVKFDFNENTIMCIVKSDDEMAKQYIASTSGLQV